MSDKLKFCHRCSQLARYVVTPRGDSGSEVWVCKRHVFGMGPFAAVRKAS